MSIQSSQQSLVPLKSHPLSSHWFFEPRDIKRIEELFDIPARPTPILSLPWQKEPTTHQPYEAGDPIFLGGSPTPFMFKGFTRMRFHNTTGECAEMALFQTSSNVNPVYSFSLLLYRKVTIKSSQTSTHSLFWDALKGYLGGCFH